MIRLKYHERPKGAVVLDEVVATLTPWSAISRPDIASKHSILPVT